MFYPGGSKKNALTNKKNIIYANRGMGLENLINESNEFYLEKDIAVIYKKPTPITISEVKYGEKERVITKAYFRTPSTLDYNGIYKGKYIDFEAKETKSTTSFALSNIHNHQIEHLKRINYHGGIGFVIIRFVKLDKTFLLFISDLINFIDTNKRASIPVSYFEEKGYLIKEGLRPRLDYLKIIDMEGVKYEKKD